MAQQRSTSHDRHHQDTSTQHGSQEMSRCISDCEDCATVCRDTVSYCLSQGNEHARPDHIWLMMDCAEICMTSVHFMMHNSVVHQVTCRACAEVCEKCATDCEQFGDDQQMQACAEACRRCAGSCRQMAGV